MSIASKDKDDASFLSGEYSSMMTSTIRSNSTSNLSSSFSQVNTSSADGSASSAVGRPAYVDPIVAEQEKRAVFRSRILVILVLVMAVAAAVTVTVLLLRDQEKKEFEIQLEAYSSEVITVSTEKAEKALEAIKSFSTTVSSLAKATNATWPFVTIPDFSARSEHLINLIDEKQKPGEENIGFVFCPIVNGDVRGQWEQYTRNEAPSMILDLVQNSKSYAENDLELWTNITVPVIWTYNASLLPEVVPIYETKPGPWPVSWQPYPLSPLSFSVNYNVLNGERIASTFYKMNATLEATINFVKLREYAESQILQPIFRDIGAGAEKELVAFILITIDWINYFKDILPPKAEPIDVVMKSSCGEDVITYQISGQNATYVGEYDGHDTKYDSYETSSPFVSVRYDPSKISEGQCVPNLSLHVYPTAAMEESFQTGKVVIYTTIVVLIFGFTSLVFILYDHFVGRHQKKMMDKVIQQDKIVSDVFPMAIRERLYHGEISERKDDPMIRSKIDGLDPEDFDNPEIFEVAPIAEIFPNTTVIFADIAGFTAWSSAREPTQVFLLLESLYSAFDKIAYRHNVFKIETVGDCYVAVAGLPEPSDSHAVSIAKFAFAILKKMKDLTHKLEPTLGPDTTNLELHIGINSGQVLAGVLRGERARFQLFGDTMNTASRMQSTGVQNRIHISESTAILLKSHGYNRFIKPRRDPVTVKGKGKLQTYFLISKEEAVALKKRKKSANGNLGKVSENPAEDIVEEKAHFDEEDNVEYSKDTTNNMTKTERLVAYNVQVLTSLLQQILAARETTQESGIQSNCNAEQEVGKFSTVLEEFIPIIPLRRFVASELEKRRDPSTIVLSEAAKQQLKDYVTQIASMYQQNPFHNFQHACHVTSSVRKLLSRIVDVSGQTGLRSSEMTATDLNLVDLVGHSYGITSDPLTQFAVVFSAVIHDVDHPGVTNAQLVAEKTRNAKIYEKSIAEQNSVDLAWDLLMSTDYKDFRACIYANDTELRRFRQLVVNTVMATDICDKELQALRKVRWDRAFLTTEEISEDEAKSEDRKATIVIEHLIQASDVSHTMQHWHIYKDWNEKLFMEMYKAFQTGRAATDPSAGWYEGEIGFFDFYVIPLAKKLENCGVFGVSSHEYLNYAMQNREQWAREGKSVVEGYVKEYNSCKDDESKGFDESEETELTSISKGS